MEINAVKLFREKCEVAMAKVQTIEEFRATDPMVDFVFKVGRELFDRPLDQQSPDRLLQLGGKLVGAFPYLGQMSARARAERDIYSQKLDETEKEIMIKLLDSDYKVTQARAEVAIEVMPIKDIVTFKEAQKNQWENITEACQSMVMFCQSALRVKEGERFSSSRVQNQ